MKKLFTTDYEQYLDEEGKIDYMSMDIDFDAIKEELKQIDYTNSCAGYVIFGSVGRWNGSRFGYKLFKNLEDLFYDTGLDEFTLYIDNNNLKLKGYNHDASSEFTIKKVINYDDYDLIYNNGLSKSYIKTKTRSLSKDIKSYFGY